jgi:hypothetical protein
MFGGEGELRRCVAVKVRTGRTTLFIRITTVTSER